MDESDERLGAAVASLLVDPDVVQLDSVGGLARGDDYQGELGPRAAWHHQMNW